MITFSIISSSIVQADGRLSVTEQHTYDSGYIWEFTYLADADMDLQTVANLRAANINTELERRNREELAALNYEVPIPVRKFFDLVPQSDRLVLRQLAKTNVAMEDALAYLTAGQEVFKSRAVVWLNALVTAGVMQQSTVDTIFTEWDVKYG